MLEPQRDPEQVVSLHDVDTNILIAKAEKENAKKNPLEPIVNKFAEMGYTPAQAFDMLDDDMDEVLTIKEITDGMKHHNIVLTDEEWKQLLAAIDANSDGVLSLEEWENILVPKVKAQTDMYAIMGAININDPLVLEEKILDLQYRNRYLESELKVLRSQNGKSALKQ